MLNDFRQAEFYAELAVARAKLNDITTPLHNNCISEAPDGAEYWNIAWFEDNARVAEEAAKKAAELTSTPHILVIANRAVEEAKFGVELAKFENSFRCK